MDESAAPRSLSELAGRQLDDRSPALTIDSARQLVQADVEDLVRSRAEDPDLLESDGPALEVVFSIAGEPGKWVWRFRLDGEDLPEEEPGAYLADEVVWRLLEWRDTREQRRLSAAPRLLRAS
jgi:hypothetical protein